MSKAGEEKAPVAHVIRAEMYADAEVPTRWGNFRVVAFHNNRDSFEHLAIMTGDTSGAENLLVRVHSECLTGEVLGSLKCDCREQLELAFTRIRAEGRGAVLYLRQEGRGIGLGNKIRAYELQNSGLDTVEANLQLGFHDDERRYDVAAAMIRALDIKSIRLLTNNPRKIEGLKANGIIITERVPLEVAPNEYNVKYLQAKRDKFGHLLTLAASRHIRPL